MTCLSHITSELKRAETKFNNTVIAYKEIAHMASPNWDYYFLF